MAEMAIRPLRGKSHPDVVAVTLEGLETRIHHCYPRFLAECVAAMAAVVVAVAVAMAAAATAMAIRPLRGKSHSIDSYNLTRDGSGTPLPRVASGQ